MEYKHNEIEIIESTLPKDHCKEFNDKILSYILYCDNESGRLMLNPDYKIVLLSQKCNALKYFKNLESWENVVDLEYFSYIIRDISDERLKYFKSLADVDKDNYNSMYFLIKKSLIESTVKHVELLFLLIIGKKKN